MRSINIGAARLYMGVQKCCHIKVFTRNRNIEISSGTHTTVNWEASLFFFSALLFEEVNKKTRTNDGMGVTKTKMKTEKN